MPSCVQASTRRCQKAWGAVLPTPHSPLRGYFRWRCGGAQRGAGQPPQAPSARPHAAARAAEMTRLCAVLRSLISRACACGRNPGAGLGRPVANIPPLFSITPILSLILHDPRRKFPPLPQGEGRVREFQSLFAWIPAVNIHSVINNFEITGLMVPCRYHETSPYCRSGNRYFGLAK